MPGYAGEGTKLVVLYQMRDFLPQRRSAYPSDLPGRAGEGSEEHFPVAMLALEEPLR